MSRERWAHTSLVCAILATVNSKKRFKPDDFNPHAESRHDDAIELTKENIGLLREAFTGQKG